MSKNNDGGPAFPLNTENVGTRGAFEPYSGMSLRDYFVAHMSIEELTIAEAEALMGCKVPADAQEAIRFFAEAYAKYCGILADAKLAERAKKLDR